MSIGETSWILGRSENRHSVNLPRSAGDFKLCRSGESASRAPLGRRAGRPFARRHAGRHFGRIERVMERPLWLGRLDQKSSPGIVWSQSEPSVRSDS